MKTIHIGQADADYFVGIIVAAIAVRR